MIILEHPLASNLQLGINIQDRDRHVVHQQLSLFYSTISCAKVVTSIHWAAIEWKLNTTKDNTNNLVIKDEQRLSGPVSYLASESFSGSIGLHGEPSGSSLALMDNTRELCATIKVYAHDFYFGP